MDTVVYRLHNLQNYPITLKAVGRLKGGRGMMLVEDIPDFKAVTSFRQAFFNKDRDTFHLMRYNAKAFLPSSEGGINISYDESQQFIAFECSLPKFFYGNNVCELIPPFISKYFQRNITDMHNLCADFWYRLMRMAFKKMIRDLTLGFEKVDWRDVQLFRFDIAFNQIFNKVLDTKLYLDSIGCVSAPRILDSKKTKYDNGNVTFLCENYYFKVYHKGTDFADKGRKQIEKLFDEVSGKPVHTRLGLQVRGRTLKDDSNLQKSMEQIDNLQGYADRILRYELECTSKLMSYLFNVNLKKMNIKAYKKLCSAVFYLMRPENYEVLNAVEIYYRLNDGKLSKTKPLIALYDCEYYLPDTYFNGDSAKKEKVLVVNERLIVKIEKMFRIASMLRVKYLITNFRTLKNVYKFLAAEKSKEHKFFFATPVTFVEKDGKVVETTVIDSERCIHPSMIPQGVHYDGPVMELMQPVDTDQRLSMNLINLCIEKHQKLFKTLQFEALPEVQEIEKLCLEYNKHIDSLPKVKGQKKEQKMHVNLMKSLAQVHKRDTWDDLRLSGNVSRHTLRNWKLKFQKLLGFSKAINYISNVDLTNVCRYPENQYSRHYDELLVPENPLSVFLQNTPELLLV